MMVAPTRAGALLVAIDALAPSQRLPWLMRYLSSLHNIFISPCRACAHILRPSTLGPSTLLPATSRSPKLEPYHAACYLQVRRQQYSIMQLLVSCSY